MQKYLAESLGRDDAERFWSAQCAHESKINRAAREISASIAGLPHPVTDEQVLDVMQNHKCEKHVLRDALFLMDNEPTKFASYQMWHVRLRSLLNNPNVSEKLFALFL